MGYYLEKKYWNVLYIYSFRENEGKRKCEFCLINYAKLQAKLTKFSTLVLRQFATLEDEINLGKSVTLLVCNNRTVLKLGALKRARGLFEQLSFRALRDKAKIE